MNDIALAVIWLGAFSMVVLSVYFYMKYRAQTPIEVIKAERSFNFRFSLNLKKIGIIVIGVALGLFFISFLKILNDSGVVGVNLLNEMTAMGSLTLFIGGAMIIANNVDKTNSKDNK